MLLTKYPHKLKKTHRGWNGKCGVLKFGSGSLPPTAATQGRKAQRSLPRLRQLIATPPHRLLIGSPLCAPQTLFLHWSIFAPMSRRPKVAYRTRYATLNWLWRRRCAFSSCVVVPARLRVTVPCCIFYWKNCIFFNLIFRCIQGRHPKIRHIRPRA